VVRLSISLFGGFHVTRDGQPVRAFESDQVRALLAYLAVEQHHPPMRGTLADLLWPDHAEAAARANLRHALSRLRHTIGDHAAAPSFLLSTYQTIQLNPAAEISVDVARFAGLLAACEQHAHDRLESCPACIARLREAVDLYRGAMLGGQALSRSIVFEEWVRVTQERLHRMALAALGTLAEEAEARGAYAEAERYLQRCVALDPWLEEAHYQLMRVLALAGWRSAAMAQYERCRKILGDDLGIEASVQTTALYEQIRTQSSRFSFFTLPLATPVRQQKIPAHSCRKGRVRRRTRRSWRCRYRSSPIDWPG
jgi:DNA-binding SARP family transcriptional activator